MCVCHGNQAHDETLHLKNPGNPITFIMGHGRCFREVERADYVVELLCACQHNGFPVVRGRTRARNGGGSSGGFADGAASDPGGSEDEAEDNADVEADADGGAGCASREGTLQGVILRSQLLVMLREQARSRAGSPTLPLHYNSHLSMLADPPDKHIGVQTSRLASVAT